MTGRSSEGVDDFDGLQGLRRGLRPSVGYVAMLQRERDAGSSDHCPYGASGLQQVQRVSWDREGHRKVIWLVSSCDRRRQC